MTTDEEIIKEHLEDEDDNLIGIDKVKIALKKARQDEAKKIFAELEESLVPEYYIDEKGNNSQEWYLDMTKESLYKLKKKFGGKE